MRYKKRLSLIRTHCKSGTDGQNIPLHDKGQERKDRNKNRCHCEKQIKHDRVESCWNQANNPPSVMGPIHHSECYDTFDHPLEFKFSSVKNPLDPAVLPSKELDKFDLWKGYAATWVVVMHWVIRARTALMSSFNTPIRLSFAANTPFWILILRLARKLFTGRPIRTTENPTKALHPKSLYSREHLQNEHCQNQLTDRGNTRQW